MSDYTHLRHWLTGEGYGRDYTPRPVILECVYSRSGMSMTVYDRDQALFRVNGCGFDRVGDALGRVLETLFQPELLELFRKLPPVVPGFYGIIYDPSARTFQINGCGGFESMVAIAEALGLTAYRTDSKSGTLIVITKKGA